MCTSTRPTRYCETAPNAVAAPAAASLAAAALIAIAALARGGAEPAARPPAQRGIALGLYSEDPSWDYGEFFDEIAATGATHVSIVAPWYVRDTRATEVFDHDRFTVPMRTVERCISDARARGLKVFLFPILRVEDKSDGGWRGVLDPADLDAFFESYREFILRFARLAAKREVPVLSVGSELASLERHERRWRRLITEIRQLYPGELTYSANWDHYEELPFWDALDYVGVTGYFELADKEKPASADPPLATLVHSWREHHRRLTRFAAGAGKPLLLTEVGYLSQRGAAARPWNEAADEPLDLEQQRRCYEAFWRVWNGEPRLAGVYFWNWFGWGGADSKEYTPRGKPAAKEVARWYGGPGAAQSANAGAAE